MFLAEVSLQTDPARRDAGAIFFCVCVTVSPGHADKCNVGG